MIFVLVKNHRRQVYISFILIIQSKCFLSLPYLLDEAVVCYFFKFMKGTCLIESINSFFSKMEEKTVKRRCGADVLLFSHWFNCLYCRQGGRVASALDLYSTGCMGSINSRSHHWLALFFSSAKFNPWATLLNIEPDRLQLVVVASSKNR